VTSVLRGCGVLLALALAVGAVACGSLTNPADEASGAADNLSPEVKTYVNPEFDFAFDYDPAFMEGPKNVASPSSSSPGLLAMRFTTSEDDGLVIMAEQLDIAVDRSNADWIEKELASEMDALATYLDPEGSRTPLEAVDVNGAWGFVTTFTYHQDGMSCRARQYLLYRDTFQYKLSMSDAVEDWGAVRPCFDLVIDTFRPAE